MKHSKITALIIALTIALPVLILKDYEANPEKETRRPRSNICLISLIFMIRMSTMKT